MATPEEKQQKEFVRAVYKITKEWIDQGKTDEEIILLLSDQGFDRETSLVIINNIKKAEEERTYDSILYGSLWLAGGLIVTLISYSAAAGGGTYIATYGAIGYGAIRLLTGLFAKSSKYGLIGLVVLIALGIGVWQFMAHTESAKKQKDQTQINQKFDRLNNAEMNIINPFNDTHISIAMPNTMLKEKSEDSTSSIIEYEEFYNSYNDIFRIGIERILKSEVRSDIKNLSDLVAALQEPSDSLDNRRFAIDTTNIRCQADKNGYNSLYYYSYRKGYKSNVWGKTIYTNDEKYYYTVNVWIPPSYKTELSNLIDKVISSFNIEK
jgi:hypothetical protein